MKKLAIALLGLTVVSSAVFAQTNQVLSRNAVGYVRVDTPSNKLNLVRLDFVNLAGGNYTVTNLIGNQLAQGGALYIWDLSNQTYVGENKLKSGWSPGTNAIRRGAGFFIYSLSNNNVFLMGEVPDSITAPTTTVNVLGGLNLTGYPYPADATFTSTPMFTSSAQGDAIYLWDVTGQTYGGYNRLKSGWSPADYTNLTFRPGQGFWYLRNSGGASWQYAKPYTWP